MRIVRYADTYVAYQSMLAMHPPGTGADPGFFREGDLNIEVISEAGGLGGAAPQKLWVFLVIE